MFDEGSFNLKELDNIDFSFIDQFMMSDDFVMEPLIHIEFPNRINQENIVRFILIEILLRLNEKEMKRTSRQY
jgi:hypothetical protein